MVFIMSEYVDMENETSGDGKWSTENSTYNKSLEEFLFVALGPKHLPLTSLVPLTVIFTLLFITGVLGNISVCAVIIRNTSMHTATNYYLFNLAISDLNLLILGKQYLKRGTLHYLEVVTLKCEEYDKLYFQWEIVTEFDTVLSHIHSDQPFIVLDGYQFSENDIQDFSTIFAAKVKISHFSDFSDHIHDIVYFKFTPHYPKIRIKGGMSRTYPVDMDLVLDGRSDSRDLSYAPGEDEFAWNRVIWRTRPLLSAPVSSSLIWRIPASYFKDGDAYIFSLTVNRTKIPDYEVQTIAYQEVIFVRDVPLLEIECISNYLYPQYLDVTAFQVTCIGNCDNGSYAWFTNPDVLKEGSFDFGNDTNKLLIKPKVLKEGAVYTFECRLGSAVVVMALEYLRTINVGECTIEPISGVAGATVFEVFCRKFWTYNGELTFMVYQGDVKKDEKAVLVSYGPNEIVSNIMLAEGENIISVLVVDDHLMEEYVTVGKVQVQPFKDSLTENQDIVRTVKSIIFGKGGNSLEALLVENLHHKLIQTISVLLSTINDLPISRKTKNDLMKHMMMTLTRVKFGNIMVATQILSVMWKVVEAKEETNSQVTSLQAEVMLNAAKALYEYVSNPREIFVTLTYITDFAQKLLNLFSELMTRNEELLQMLRTEVPPHEYDSYDEMDSTKIIVRLDFALFTYKMIETLDIVTKTILRKMIPDQKPIEVVSGGMILSVRKLRPELLLNASIATVNETSSRVILSPETVSDLIERFETIDYKFIHFIINPFWWHIDHEYLNTKYIDFDLFKNDQKIPNLKGFADIYVDVLKNITTEKNLINGTLLRGDLAVYRLDTVRKTTLKISFSGEPKFKILLLHCPPTRDEVIWKGKTVKELLYKTENEMTELFLGIVNDLDEPQSYNGYVNNYICIVWDQTKKTLIRGGFRSSGLTHDILHCSTTHFSVFGGMIGVAPNKIEIPVELDILLFIHTNFLMIVVLILVFLLWLILMIWAIIRDRKLIKRNVVFLLQDTMPGDKYGYLIVVVTGIQFDAATTADVGFQLVGTQAESRPHLIKCDLYQPLQRGSEDWFVIYCPKRLGKITNIRLWHNCRGRKPHWYCSRIIIQELSTGEQYCFIVEKWFSLIWGDSEVSREIPVASENQIKSSKTLFPITVSRGFRDGHLWLSIFTSLPQSNFTTKERVTVIICLLLLSMLSSGMFYGIPKGDPSDAIFSQGSYYITPREVYIFLESLLVTVPAAIILVLMFKKSGPPPVLLEETSRLPNDLSVYWQQYPFVFGVGICKFRALLSEMVSYTSVLTIVAFSMERYLAICHPLHRYSMSGLKRAVKIIGVVWIISMASAAPFAVYTTINYLEYPPGSGHLAPESAFCAMLASNIPPNFPIYEISSFFFFFLPMIVILILYIRMGIQIRRRGDGKSLSLEGSVHEKRQTSSRKAIIRMLTAVVVAFFLCWAPFHAQRLLYIYFWNHPNFPVINEWIYHITGILYYVSSTVNPILYNVMSVKYRQAFKETLCGFMFPQKPRSPEESNRMDDYILRSSASLKPAKERYYSDVTTNSKMSEEHICENTNLISKIRRREDLGARDTNSLVMVIQPNSRQYAILRKKSNWPRAFLWVVRPKTVTKLEAERANKIDSDGTLEIKKNNKKYFRNGGHVSESSI